VNLPGRRQIEVSDKDIHVPEAYKVFPYSSNHLTYDYGTIILLAAKKEEMDCSFGFSATLTDREILESDLSVFGYPYVLPNEPPTLEDVRSLHGSGGRVQSVSEKNLRYVVHTSSGQSGGPVFIWSRGFWTVIGIQYVVSLIWGWWDLS
jgi:V8-like Glu-specific endopeptidase